MAAHKHLKELENIKRKCLIEEGKQRLTFLGMINDKDDNSSELAGFEINKLLQRQISLEEEYADLITKRSSLKGIANKKEFEEVQLKVAEVSTSLKESTKKLCKLFKENTKIADDIMKVGRERLALERKLEDLIRSVEAGDLNGFQATIIKELEGQNEMGEFLETEKKVNMDLKKIKKDLIDETQLYQNEMKDKDLTIQKLKEEISKAKTFAAIESGYEEKALQARGETERRLAEQKKLELKRQLEEVGFKKDREDQVFKRIEAYIAKKGHETDELVRTRANNLEAEKKEMDDVIDALNLEIADDRTDIEELRKQLAAFEELIRQEKAEERRILFEKEEKEKQELKKNNYLKIIQMRFEQYFNKMNP
jgi:chromosome segregation ATPase